MLEVTVEDYGAYDFEPVRPSEVFSANIKAKDTKLEGASSSCSWFLSVFKSIFAGAVQAPFCAFSWGIQASFSFLKYCSGSILSIWKFCRAVYFVKLDFAEEAEAKASSAVLPPWKAPLVLIGGGGHEEEGLEGIDITTPSGAEQLGGGGEEDFEMGGQQGLEIATPSGGALRFVTIYI